MHGSSLPVWAIILILGIAFNFFLGYFNPFLTKDDKKKIGDFREKKVPNLDEKLVVRLKFHFSSTAYAFMAMDISIAATAAFFIESYVEMAKSLGMGVAGYIFMLIVIFIILAVVEIMLVVFSLFAEHMSATLIIAYYERYPGVRIKNNDEW